MFGYRDNTRGVSLAPFAKAAEISFVDFRGRNIKLKRDAEVCTESRQKLNAINFCNFLLGVFIKMLKDIDEKGARSKFFPFHNKINELKIVTESLLSSTLLELTLELHWNIIQLT